MKTRYMLLTLALALVLGLTISIGSQAQGKFNVLLPELMKGLYYSAPVQEVIGDIGEEGIVVEEKFLSCSEVIMDYIRGGRELDLAVLKEDMVWILEGEKLIDPFGISPESVPRPIVIDGAVYGMSPLVGVTLALPSKHGYQGNSTDVALRLGEALQTAGLNTFLPEWIAEGWDILIQSDIDSETVAVYDTPPAEVVVSYARVWQSGNGLISELVFMFQSEADAELAYDYVVNGLRNERQDEEDLGSACVSSTGPLGLKVYILRRGRFLVQALSGITASPDIQLSNDPGELTEQLRALAPDTSLVRQVVKESDSLLQWFTGSIITPARGEQLAQNNPEGIQRSTQSTIPPCAAPHEPSTIPNYSSLAHAIHFMPVSGPSSSFLNVPPVVLAQAGRSKVTRGNATMPLYLGSKENGSITIRVKAVRLGNQVVFNVYLKSLKIGDEDGDDWIRGDGDPFVAGRVNIGIDGMDGTFGIDFRTGELGSFGPGTLMTWGGDGKFINSVTPKISIPIGKVATFSINLLVRDNDTSDGLDKMKCVFGILSVIPGKVGKVGKVGAAGVQNLKKATTRLKPRTTPAHPITDAKQISGDNIGGGTAVKDMTLP